MALQSKQIDDFDRAAFAQANDLLIIVRDPTGVNTTNTIATSVYFGNVAVDAVFHGNVTINTANNLTVNNVIITNKATPLSNTDSVTQGKIWFDDDYIYVATSNNHIKRAALSNFA